jgi:hypothetical protein
VQETIENGQRGNADAERFYQPEGHENAPSAQGSSENKADSRTRGKEHRPLAAVEKHGNYLTRSSRSRKEFLSSIDLSQTPFEIQYADFGFSKLLTDKN